MEFIKKFCFFFYPFDVKSIEISCFVESNILVSDELIFLKLEFSLVGENEN